ncbi:MAG: class I SAM-dependent methyltransferase [Fibrobacteria bacterium]|nr:class I SAM-dependent methyltransferase [Fibrobacteria bacterium]
MEFELDLRPASRVEEASAETLRLGWLEQAGLSALGKAVEHWKREALMVSLPDGSRLKLGDPTANSVQDIRVLSPRFFRRILFRGDLGFGESFTDGDWESTDLPSLLKSFVRQGSREDTWWRRGLRVVDAVRHRMRANTLEGSKRNIQAHYDLGNAFYAAWLDPSMQYSAGIYARPDSTLEDSQDLKLKTLIAKLVPRPGLRILEIGSGWGELAIRLARDHGCRVTTVTLSPSQHSWVVERVRKEGLEHLVDARIQDYREISGTFDRIVSVEMVEAVGHENLPGYFSRLDAMLVPGGHAVIQAITTAEQNYDRYRRRTDWIQAYIFPGAVCPSIGAMISAMTESSRLVVRQIEDIGPHYARNLAHWRERFLDAWPKLERLGFDDNFRRSWTYYLSYCEAGFSQRKLGDIQMVLSRMSENDLPDTVPTCHSAMRGGQS